MYHIIAYVTIFLPVIAPFLECITTNRCNFWLNTYLYIAPSPSTNYTTSITCKVCSSVSNYRISAITWYIAEMEVYCFEGWKTKKKELIISFPLIWTSSYIYIDPRLNAAILSIWLASSTMVKMKRSVFLSFIHLQHDFNYGFCCNS